MVSLIHDSCVLDIGCKSESTKPEIHSVGPPLPETIDLSTGVGLCIWFMPVFWSVGGPTVSGSSGPTEQIVLIHFYNRLRQYMK